MSPTTPPTSPAEKCILVLQGGGALGAYQAGVFEAMAGHDLTPQWVAGISIGAINAALIAGNPPERRLERLRDFWEIVSSAYGTPPAGWPDRSWFNEASALRALLFGVPGFFAPRIPPAPFQPPGSRGAISYYDTEPLRRTLDRLVDFDRLNDGGIRISVGAVNVRSGNFAYFDSARQRLDVRHIMASAALPPGLPPIEIDGEFFWDGGIVSNTPLQHVLDHPGRGRCVVFQVDLFPARGELPTKLSEVGEREKEIRFSSRTRLITTHELQRQAIAQAAQRLLERLPPSLHRDPDVQLLAQLHAEAEVTVVHLIYRSQHHEGESKDYEFSRLSMRERWTAGRADTARTLDDPRWRERGRGRPGVHVYDLTSGDRTPSRLNTT